MILLVGGAGFLGSCLAEYLVVNGYKVRVFDIFEPLVNRDEVEFIRGDYLQIGDFDFIFKDVQIVIHLVHTTVPQTSMADMSYDVVSNVLPSISLLQMVTKHKIKKFIFISSGGTVYGVPSQELVTETHPTSPISSYGITKLTIERYIQMFSYLYGLNSFILRLSNPYGVQGRFKKNQGVIPLFLNAIKETGSIEVWGDGSVVRDFIYVDDFCEALLEVLKKDIKPDIYNIGSGIGHSLNDVIKVIRNQIGKFEVVYKNGREIDIPKIVLDTQKFENQTGWKAHTSLEDGIKRCSQFFWNI